jgi:hypothetical protein
MYGYISIEVIQIMIGINAFVIFIVFLIENHLINSSKSEIPSIMTKEALQWLNIPHRWREQYTINLSSNEINHSLKQLEHLNENGIPQYDTQSIDSVSMEVYYEVSQLSRRIQ